jgi:hypothetical protein
MFVTLASGLTVADLEQALRNADPAALLVSPRILKRVIKRDRGLSRIGLQVPHRKNYLIPRDALLKIADRAELGVAEDLPLPDVIHLFPAPYPQRLATLSPEAILVKYWRLLFHSHVHAALSRRAADGQLTDAALRERARGIGTTEFAEARTVLEQEDFLLPPVDLRTTYEEFAALYLELRYFDPQRLAAFFPSIADYQVVDRVLAEDLDAAALFAATRLEGAPEPAALVEQTEEPGPPVDVLPPQPGAMPDEWLHARLLARADRVAERGNVVRAAILRLRAAEAAPGDRAETVRAAEAEIERLLTRLQKALGLAATEIDPWRKGLMALLEPASRGLWPIEARLLYDLQKVCIDQEREIYAVDLVEWFITLGRRPVKRLLPNQGQVLTVKHLRSAARRLSGARLPEEERRRLAGLIQAAIHHSEQRLRDRLRVHALHALEEVGLTLGNFAESVARDKLVEELLDRVVERGFLQIGDLRDAIARNRLKLSDLSTPSEFLVGDKLIKANRQFAYDLDGVYRRGEIYLRWLQRLSSAAFGTRVGRFLTRYVALPIGGAFVALEGFGHIVHMLSGDEVKLVNVYSWPLASLFLLGLLYVAPFRRGVVEVCRRVWLVVRGVCYDLPRFVLNLPLVRKLLNSRTYLTLYQYVLKPLAWSVLMSLGLLWVGFDNEVVLGAGAAVFLVVSLLINSRFGMRLEEVAADRLARTWYWIRFDLAPGLFRFILFVFKRLVEDVERVLYAVDERLRFKTGDSRLSLVIKPVLGLVWFCVAYVVRFCVNLLIEPQINPIKHFPVVTVSHKIILPVVAPALTNVLAQTMDRPLAASLAVVITGAIPGIFGFLVWELKENWRLYRANQSPVLEPEIVGSHGETVPRLLRPGLHSGTVPKLFAKLRRAKGGAAHKQRDGLMHVEEAVRHFVERTLLAYLAGSKCWNASAPTAGAIHLGCNRIRIELSCPALADENLILDLEEHGGRLVAGIANAGWSIDLADDAARALADALAGFYKMAGVDVIREQVAEELPNGAAFEVADEGLVVWSGPDYASAAVYELNGEAEWSPRRVEGLPTARIRKLKADRILFDRTPILWNDWVSQWETDHAGKGHRKKLLRGVRLTPRV